MLACAAVFSAQPRDENAVAAGKAILQGKGGCLNCHSIDNRGGSLGPDLSEIGLTRTPQALRLSIVDPDAEIVPEYVTVLVTPKKGAKIEGICLNEDDLSIQIRDPAGALHSFLRDDLKSVQREDRSLMPPFAGKLSAAEIDNVVAYLRILPDDHKRHPAPVSDDVERMNRATRDREDLPEMVLDNLQIPKGAMVADLGAGTGYFTWRLAQRVGPDGKVFAVDVQHDMLDRTAQELKKRNLTNVDLVVGRERNPRLPEGALDLVLAANSYHEFSQPAAMLGAIRRSLKPGGRLVVIEDATEKARTPNNWLYTMSLPELRSEIEAAGFQLDRVLDFLPWQHGLIFSKAPIAESKRP
jgi:putative heme-binding domain-containing protein